MPNNNDITNQELAMIIKESFDGVDKRFEKVENRLESLERGQDEIKMKMAYVA
jgi:hypothetical protein